MTFLHGVKVTEVLSGSFAVQTLSSSIIGLVGTAPDALADKFPLNTPVAIVRSADAQDLGEAGTLPGAVRGVYDQASAVIVVVRVDGANEAAQITAAAGDSVARTGVHAFLAAEAVTQFKPRILAAPGLTHQRPGGNANPVVAAFKTVTERLRACAFVDGPSTDDAAVKTAADEAGSDRIYVVDPFVLVAGENSPVPRPASSRFAGVQARMDQSRGFWWSLSNQPINGIVGMARPIEFGVDDNSQSGALNAQNVGTIVFNNGYRTWGNRGTGNNSQTQFLSVRRTTDIIADAIERSFLQAIDRPISSNTLTSIRSSLEAYLRELTALGAILGGSVYLNPELNTRESLASGRLYIDVDFEPPAPMEGLSVRLSRNAGYYDEVFAQAA